MKNLVFWSLIGVNGVLAAGLAAHLLGDTAAVAQVPAATSRDDYLMIPGEINGGNNAIVYVLDETTHQLSTMSYDDSMHKLATMSPRDLNRDFDSMSNQPGGGGRRR
jgi:hypothetical protein